MAIAFFGTGGTISNRGTGSGQYLDYLDRGEVMSAKELISLYPALDEISDIRVESFGTLRSEHVTSEHWKTLAQRLDECLKETDIVGAVIAHGNGTLEVTAWFLHLVVATNKPVVIVGAQRPGNTVGSDTALNLADAFRVAVSPQSVGAGVTVVMNRQIHSARDVSKVANHSLTALQSPVRGALGMIQADNTVRYWRKPPNPHTTDSAFAATAVSAPRVDIVHAYTDADATAVDAFLAAGAAGLIAVGYPPGTLTQPLDDAIDIAIGHGILVVRATRAQLEPQVMARSGVVGRGLIANTDITPTKARILLQLCLAHRVDRDDTAEIFAAY